MNQSIKYLLDANVFIEAHRRYYAFDIVPSFWQTLVQLAVDNKIITIDRVKQEIISTKEEDVLSNWAIDEFDRWFMPTDDVNVFKSYGLIMNWVQKQSQYYDSAKSEFASVADSWLIAYAMTYGYKIVTHEQFKRDVKKRILIPNVCRAFNVPFIDTFEMLRRLNVRI